MYFKLKPPRNFQYFISKNKTCKINSKTYGHNAYAKEIVIQRLKKSWLGKVDVYNYY